MANYNTVVVDEILASNPEITGKEDYRSNTQVIPVEFSTDGTYSADTLTFTAKRLPADAKVVDIRIQHTAIAGGTLSIGTEDDTDAILASVDISSAGVVAYPSSGSAGGGAPVDVGSLSIVGELTGTFSTDSLAGYITISTGQ